MLRGTVEYRAHIRKYFPEAPELFIAVMDGTSEDVHNRLRAGDSPNVLSIQAQTPLFLATRYVRDLPKARLLIDAGARFDYWDGSGMHVVHWAVDGSKHGEDVTCLGWILHYTDALNIQTRIGSDFQGIRPGWTPLHVGANVSALPAVQLLIELGANVNCVANDGSTPLHISGQGYLGRVYKRMIRTLLDAGADPNCVDTSGRTPLHILAADYGRYRKSAIQLLLSRGASADIRDNNGLRPLDVIPDGHLASNAIRRLLRNATKCWEN